MVNKVYVHEETPITFKSAAGTAAFTPTSLATVTGRQSAHHDLGTSARALTYAWRAYCQFSTTPAVGEVIEIYIKTSDGAHPDNDDGTGDLAVSSIDKLKNLTQIGVITVDQASTAIEFASSGFISLPQRYVAVVFWNATAYTLSATAADNGFILTPVPFEIQ